MPRPTAALTTHRGATCPRGTAANADRRVRRRRALRSAECGARVLRRGVGSRERRGAPGDVVVEMIPSAGSSSSAPSPPSRRRVPHGREPAHHGFARRPPAVRRPLPLHVTLRVVEGVRSGSAGLRGLRLARPCSRAPVRGLARAQPTDAGGLLRLQRMPRPAAAPPAWLPAGGRAPRGDDEWGQTQRRRRLSPGRQAGGVRPPVGWRRAPPRRAARRRGRAPARSPCRPACGPAPPCGPARPAA
jgi:hypothetical protein